LSFMFLLSPILETPRPQNVTFHVAQSYIVHRSLSVVAAKPLSFHLFRDSRLRFLALGFLIARLLDDLGSSSPRNGSRPSVLNGLRFSRRNGRCHGPRNGPRHGTRNSTRNSAGNGRRYVTRPGPCFFPRNSPRPSSRYSRRNFPSSFLRNSLRFSPRTGSRSRLRHGSRNSARTRRKYSALSGPFPASAAAPGTSRATANVPALAVTSA